MFTELLPVLKDRMVTITIASLDENLLRVNVVPTRKSDKGKETADNALSTPLTVTATAQELDREFARQVLSFSGSYERAASNIAEIEKAHAAAVKAAEDERRNAKGKRPSTTTPMKAATRTESDSPAPANGKLVFGSNAPDAPAPAVQSLFDSQSADPLELARTTEPADSPQLGVAGAAMPAATDTQATGSVTALAKSDSLDRANSSQTEPEANSGPVICQICQCAIQPSQKRHSLMPIPGARQRHRV